MRLLGARAVFSGDFSRRGAEAVGGATLASLSTLAEKLLIQRRPDVEDEARCHIHELVRQYALRRLQQGDAGAVERARSAHLEYLLALVERAEGAWAPPPKHSVSRQTVAATLPPAVHRVPTTTQR